MSHVNLEELQKNLQKTLNKYAAVFEIPVITKDGEQDHILIETIEINDAKEYGLVMKCQRVPFNKEESESPYIACTFSKYDPDFSLNENIQAMYDQLLEDINKSDFFKLNSGE